MPDEDGFEKELQGYFKGPRKITQPSESLEDACERDRQRHTRIDYLGLVWLARKQSYRTTKLASRSRRSSRKWTPARAWTSEPTRRASPRSRSGRCSRKSSRSWKSRNASCVIYYMLDKASGMLSKACFFLLSLSLSLSLLASPPLAESTCTTI